MSPTFTRPGFALPNALVPVTRTIETDAGTDGRFWSVWTGAEDSHNYSDLSIILSSVPPYFASSPEQWFDPTTGQSPAPAADDEAVIRQPAPASTASTATARAGFRGRIPRHWYFMVPAGTKEFKVAVNVLDPNNVLRVEVHAPDRSQEEIAVRGGAWREIVVPVEPHLAGRPWFIRLEMGSATRFVTTTGNPRQLNIEADIELHGVPGYLAPTWEQWFDPNAPKPANER